MLTPMGFPSSYVGDSERLDYFESTQASVEKVSSLHNLLPRMRKIQTPHLNLQQVKNIQVFSDTVKYLEEHELSSFEVDLFSRESASAATGLPAISRHSEIIVVNTTTFQMASELLGRGLKPLVLDMANKSSPGGSVLEGSPAQEETLCRQSNLYLALKRAQANGFYPIPEHAGVLIKNVTFFRNDNYDFLDSPFRVDVFASAAYDCNLAHVPDFENNLCGYDRPDANEDYANGTKSKIRIMLQAAKENGNDSLILSAFGCGAFKNDPVQISVWYKEVLNEPEFRNSFKLIVFSIKDSGKGNFEAFKNTFLATNKEQTIL